MREIKPALSGIELPFANLFERLDRATADQRAELFYCIENRWCWHCGREQWEEVHAECGVSSDADVGMVQRIGGFLSRALCRVGLHDWRDGPGYPCTVCGEPEDSPFAP